LIAHLCRWMLRHKPWAGLEARHFTTFACFLADIAQELLLLFNSLIIVVLYVCIYARVGFIGQMVNWAIIGNGQEHWGEK